MRKDKCVDVSTCRRDTWVSRSCAAKYPLHRLMDASVEMCAYESVRLMGIIFCVCFRPLLGILYYENGEYNGTNTYYNENGVIIMTLQFKNGALDGEARFFSSEGSLLAIYLYENNIRGKIQFYVIDDESPSKEHNYKPDF